MPEWLDVIILGVIEGITEFLPISSTGHLLLAQQWLRHRQSDAFLVMIQGGAVAAVLMVFHARVKQLLFEWRTPAVRDYLLKLIAAFVVTAAGGLALKKAGFELPEEALPVGIALLVGGILFLVLERWLHLRPSQEQVTWSMALAIGVAQLVAAIFPGTSRSGATILIALVMGLSRPVAIEFTFLLGVPTLLAAGVLESRDYLRGTGADAPDWPMLALGVIAAAVSAFAAVRWLLGYVQRHSFEIFGWYRIAVGLAILLLFVLQR